MSAEALGWAWRYSPFKGSTLLVHLAIADTVNDQHNHEVWFTQEQLGRKARVSRQTVNMALAELEREGFLTRVGGGREAGAVVRFRFRFRRHLPVVYETRGVKNPDTLGVVKPDRGVKNPDTEPNRTRTGISSSSLSTARQRRAWAKRIAECPHCDEHGMVEVTRDGHRVVVDRCTHPSLEEAS